MPGQKPEFLRQGLLNGSKGVDSFLRIISGGERLFGEEAREMDGCGELKAVYY